jgi:hypothetical protein
MYIYKSFFVQLNVIVHTILITINYRDFPIYNSRDAINVVPEVEIPMRLHIYTNFIFNILHYDVCML